MKTLLLTAIYSNLNGTELGGRMCRKFHYRWSLLNILNIEPTKVICFTSQEELEELEEWFYTEQKVSKDVLEFKVYDLHGCNYYDLIQGNKDVEAVVNGDRCHEIQYMKFFWSRLIEDRHDYDRLYWIDAGLSHGGIFPEKYFIGDKWERHFLINLFNPSILDKWNNLTLDNKITIMSKNNTGRYFWSQTIPEKYYTTYNRDYHIIGGMFGGTPKSFDSFTNKFEEMLVRVLEDESDLYHEELIMTCLYNNSPDDFKVQHFDDWYERAEWKDEVDPVLFYHMFL